MSPDLRETSLPMRKQLIYQHACTHVNSRKVSPNSSRASLINKECKQPLCKATMFNPDAATQTNSTIHAPLHTLQNTTHSTYSNQLCSNWVADPSQTSQKHMDLSTIVKLLSNYLSQICTYIKLPKRCHLLCTLKLRVHNWNFWSCSNLVSNRKPVQQHPPIQAAGSASEGFLPRQNFR